MQFFQTALTSKQTITSPLNKDHHATYHQGEVSSYTIQATFKGLCPFLSKTTKTAKKLNLHINQRDEHRFVSQARFATNHPIPFNS